MLIQSAMAMKLDDLIKKKHENKAEKPEYELIIFDASNVKNLKRLQDSIDHLNPVDDSYFFSEKIELPDSKVAFFYENHLADSMKSYLTQIDVAYFDTVLKTILYFGGKDVFIKVRASALNGVELQVKQNDKALEMALIKSDGQNDLENEEIVNEQVVKYYNALSYQDFQETVVIPFIENIEENFPAKSELEDIPPEIALKITESYCSSNGISLPPVFIRKISSNRFVVIDNNEKKALATQFENYSSVCRQIVRREASKTELHIDDGHYSVLDLNLQKVYSLLANKQWVEASMCSETSALELPCFGDSKLKSFTDSKSNIENLVKLLVSEYVEAIEALHYLAFEAKIEITKDSCSGFYRPAGRKRSVNISKLELKNDVAILINKIEGLIEKQTTDNGLVANKLEVLFDEGNTSHLIKKFPDETYDKVKLF